LLELTAGCRPNIILSPHLLNLQRGRAPPDSPFLAHPTIRATLAVVYKYRLLFAVSHMGWILSEKACRYLFHSAPLGMQTTAPNWQNQIAPWWTGLPVRHANCLPAAHPRTIAGVCTSACVWVGVSGESVSVAFPFASSISMHRQEIVRNVESRPILQALTVALLSLYNSYQHLGSPHKRTRKAEWHTCRWACWVHCES